MEWDLVRGSDRNGWWGSWAPGTPTGAMVAGPGQVPCQTSRTPLPVILAEQVGLRPIFGTKLLLPSCPKTVASLTRAGTACVGPRLRQQVEKHIAQKSPQGKAEQLLQTSGPSYKRDARPGADLPEPLA